jgi:AraC family ethanolamine operon transcriptional activator
MRATEPPGGRRSTAAQRISPDATASLWPNPPADTPAEFASRVRGFGLELIQIGRGRFTANGLQVQAGKTLLSNVQFGPVVVQSWTAPMRSITIAVKACDAGALWGGFPLKRSDALLVGPAANVEIVSRPEFKLVAATFPQRDFQRVAQSCGFAPPIGGSGAIVIRLPELDVANRLRNAIEAALAQAPTHSSVPPAAEPGARDNLLRLVVSLAATGLPINPHDRNLGRWRAVEHAVTAMRNQPPDTLSVSELCRAAGVSERALRKGFVERFTLPPAGFLKAFRLNGARKDLRRLASPELRITDIANKWGFWHLGQFAGDYREWFGELPSQTLKQGIAGVAKISQPR